MAQITFNIDDAKKNKLEKIADSIGLDIPSLFSVCAAKVIKDRCIPFTLEAYDEDDDENDPFYSETNMRHLEMSLEQLKAGKVMEHELIEVD